MFARLGSLRSGDVLWRLSLLVLASLATPCLCSARATESTPPARPEAATCEGELGSVVDVVDGHSLRVSIAGSVHSVQLSCVDTPEVNQANQLVGFLGAEAAALARAFASGKEVCLVADEEASRPDRRGSLLRYVYLPDGSDLNGSIIASGFGYVYTGHPCSRQEEYRQLERKARARAVGLWDSKRRVSFELNDLGEPIGARVFETGGERQQLSSYGGGFDPYLVSRSVVFSYGSGRVAGGSRTVYVRSYYRQDGYYVRSAWP